MFQSRSAFAAATSQDMSAEAANPSAEQATRSVSATHALMAIRPDTRAKPRFQR